jgi:TPR repeat protein
LIGLSRALLGISFAVTLALASGASFAADFADTRTAAEQGDASGQSNLGVRYELGQGVPQDYAEAAKWYRRAAEQGNANGQYNLGLMYDNGKGVPQDYAEAAKWYRLAAEQGDASGQSNLGFMYDTGQGVPQDYILAHMWFNLAASRGDSKAPENRDVVAGKMTREQIAEAQRLAREWTPKPE